MINDPNESSVGVDSLVPTVAVSERHSAVYHEDTAGEIVPSFSFLHNDNPLNLYKVELTDAHYIFYVVAADAGEAESKALAEANRLYSDEDGTLSDKSWGHKSEPRHFVATEVSRVAEQFSDWTLDCVLVL